MLITAFEHAELLSVLQCHHGQLTLHTGCYTIETLLTIESGIKLDWLEGISKLPRQHNTRLPDAITTLVVFITLQGQSSRLQLLFSLSVPLSPIFPSLGMESFFMFLYMYYDNNVIISPEHVTVTFILNSTWWVLEMVLDNSSIFDIKYKIRPNTNTWIKVLKYQEQVHYLTPGLEYTICNFPPISPLWYVSLHLFLCQLIKDFFPTNLSISSLDLHVLSDHYHGNHKYLRHFTECNYGLRLVETTWSFDILDDQIQVFLYSMPAPLITLKYVSTFHEHPQRWLLLFLKH